MRRALRAGLAVATAGVCVGMASTVAGAAPACAPTPAPQDEALLTGLINAERKAEGVPRVVRQSDLQREGRRKSMAMARGARFSHADGMKWAQGKVGAQNIAMAPSAIDAFQAMLASPAHRTNMMSKDYRLTGVGAAHDCGGQIFFTVNLMAPAA